MSDQPIEPAQDAPAHDLDHYAPTSGARTMLIVEDDADFVAAIRECIEIMGYEVEVAADGVQGIRKIMAKDYTVILCDMVMPGLAGDMFYLGVERVKPHLCPRFVFMTGYQGDKKIDQFIRKVRGTMLWKPFKTQVLIETIQAMEKRVGAPRG